MKKQLLSIFVTTLPILLLAQVTFEPKFTINPNTGAQPYAIASGFIDGDAFADIVIGTANGGTIEWYKNNSDGTFTVQPLVTNSLSFITGVKLIDLNGNGFLDIVANGFSSNNIAWFVNDGNGNFGSQQNLVTGISGAADFLFADVNNDGILDLVVSAYFGNYVSWFEGDGSGNFGSGNSIDGSIARPAAMSMKDIDGDGDLDLVVATASTPQGNNIIQVYMNDLIPLGTNTFTKETNPVTDNKKYFFNVSFEDLDGDGNFEILATDLATNLDGGKFYKYKFDGTNYIETEITTSIGNPASVKMFDLDNDGLDDIILSSGRSGVGNDLVWFKNNGAGNYAAEEVIDATQSQAYVFTVTDFDNDGDFDIASCAFNQNDLNYFENQLITLSNESFESNRLSIYPNPASNWLQIKGVLDNQNTYNIYNHLGQIIEKEKPLNDKQIDVSNLSTGFYFVQLSGSTKSFKFLKL